MSRAKPEMREEVVAAYVAFAGDLTEETWKANWKEFLANNPEVARSSLWRWVRGAVEVRQREAERDASMYLKTLERAESKDEGCEIARNKLAVLELKLKEHASVLGYKKDVKRFALKCSKHSNTRERGNRRWFEAYEKNRKDMRGLANRLGNLQDVRLFDLLVELANGDVEKVLHFARVVKHEIYAPRSSATTS